jgi:hypothetical protein
LIQIDLCEKRGTTTNTKTSKNMKSSTLTRLAAALGLVAFFHPPPAEAVPLRTHPQNPYILEFRGQPTVLRTFGEQYSSVINTDFDYIPYLNVIQRDGMNLTRTFLVGFRHNNPNYKSPLAAEAHQYIQPWPRSTTAGNGLDGMGKFDFSRWNDAYFSRLTSFVQACSDRGIAVELTFFCLYYNDGEWQASPFNPSNNVQRYGPTNRYDCFRVVDANLFAVQESVVRKIVSTLNRFDNVFYEIQNEPFWNEPNVKDQQEIDFHNRMLAIIRSQESGMPNRHLVAHNFPQHSALMSPDFDIINEHYPVPIVFHNGPVLAGSEALLRDQYSRSKILSMDETDTTSPVQSRLEAWMFVLGGGGIYNGLDIPQFFYNDTDEAGDSEAARAFRAGIRNMGTYIKNLDIVALRRDLSWITSGIPSGARVQAMSQAGEQYVAYLHHGQAATQTQLSYNPIDTSTHNVSLTVNLPSGLWQAVWTRPSDLAQLKSQEFNHAGGAITLGLVSYQEDVAVRIDRIGENTGGTGDTGGDPPPAGAGIVNGSFESGHNGWTYSGNQMIRSGALGSVPDGTRFVGFNTGETQPTGVISQTFATVPGQTYALGFNLGIQSYNNNSQVMRVELTGSQPLVTQDFPISGRTDSNLAWTRKTLSFTANSNSTTLTFRDRSTTTSSIDVHIDNVNVVAGQSGDSGGAVDDGVVEEEPSEPPVPVSIVNGSFESGHNGWSNGGNQMIRTGNLGTVPDGTRFVGFNTGQTQPTGVISQTFATVPGETYTVGFHLGIQSYNNDSQVMRVEITGSQPLATQDFTISGRTDANLAWTQKALSFTADSNSATLTFRDRSTTTSAIDVHVDNVKVTK